MSDVYLISVREAGSSFRFRGRFFKIGHVGAFIVPVYDIYMQIGQVGSSIVPFYAIFMQIGQVG
ncbi:MAG TPA: hypothetical protein VK144_00300, partial [Bacillota bacterium]|nr:hypothetical protein [Bacillota bacterium]